MSKELFRTLMSNLASSSGIQTLYPDEHNHCFFFLDDSLQVDFQYNHNQDTLVIFSSLGTITNYSKELYIKLLNANFFWQGTNGSTIGIN